MKTRPAIGMYCTIVSHNIALTKPFKYFLDTLHSLPYSKITIVDNGGVTGEGEIVHALDANGEIQQSGRYLQPMINHLLSGFMSVSSIDDIKEIMKHFRLNILHNTGLMCGIEQALFGILCKRKGQTLRDLLGGSKAEVIHIQTTIPMENDFESYKESIDSIINKHNPKFVKFKVGFNTALESRVIHYLRSCDSEVSISVDANQAFPDVRSALAFLDTVRDTKLCWAEQLLAKDDIAGMKILNQSTAVPLMIDESLHTPLEAEYFCQNYLANYFNIKLAKTGGILKALEIIKIADKHNVKTMLGSMLHGKLGLEYNLGFALSQDFITNDFFSYFNTPETKDLGYITNDLSVSSKSLIV